MDPTSFEADEELRRLVEAGDNAVAYSKDAKDALLDYDLVEAAIRYFVSQGGDIVRSGALQMAVYLRDISLLHVFASIDGNCFEQVDGNGRTALMYAAAMDVTNYVECCTDDPIGVCKELVEVLGVSNVQTLDRDGRCAFDHATEVLYHLLYHHNREDYKATLKAIRPLLKLLEP